jgi:hypothetical protein
MRNWLLVLCLVISVGTLAQGTKKVISDTAIYSILDPPSGGKDHKPLYIIDGVVYKGNIRKINLKNVLSFDVLTPPGSIAVYGKDASNGVILLQTKPTHFDNITKDRALIDSAAGDKAVYIINDQISQNKLEGVKADDVLSVEVKKDASDMSINNTADDVTVLVVTKKYAIDSNHFKFSYFSDKYKSYLESHQNDDNDCAFTLNGNPVTGKNKYEIIQELYKISPRKIKTVDCLENPAYNGGESKREIVVITTKE